MSFRLERLAHGSQCVHRNANWFVRVNHSVRSHLRLHRFRFVRVICKGIDYLLRRSMCLKGDGVPCVSFTPLCFTNLILRHLCASYHYLTEPSAVIPPWNPTPLHLY